MERNNENFQGGIKIENIYRIKYAVLDYEATTEMEVYGEVKEEIVGEMGLARIEM